MFKIIGADQKQYGPISEVQIRQWIQDGRLNEHTQAQREGSSDWQPLSAFPEFAEVFHPEAAAPPSTFAPPPQSATMGAPIPTGTRESALSAVKGPAIALIIVASLGVVAGLVNAGLVAMGHNSTADLSSLPPEARAVAQNLQGPVGVIASLVGMALYGFIIFGALKLMRLQSFNLALAACIASMIPCIGCCCILGLPFGIWALVVINKPEIKSQFS